MIFRMIPLIALNNMKKYNIIENKRELLCNSFKYNSDFSNPSYAYSGRLYFLSANYGKKKYCLDTFMKRK